MSKSQKFFLIVLVASLSFSAMAQPIPATAPAGAATEPSDFTLQNSLSVRDPFRRPVAREALGDEGGNIPELQRFELDKFKLVGIITGPKKNKAMVTTPEGKMHILTEDVLIGTRRGKVTKIAPGIISVEEKVVNLLGQEEKVETYIEFENTKDKREGGSQ